MVFDAYILQPSPQIRRMVLTTDQARPATQNSESLPGPNSLFHLLISSPTINTAALRGNHFPRIIKQFRGSEIKLPCKLMVNRDSARSGFKSWPSYYWVTLGTWPTFSGNTVLFFKARKIMLAMLGLL